MKNYKKAALRLKDLIDITDQICDIQEDSADIEADQLARMSLPGNEYNYINEVVGKNQLPIISFNPSKQFAVEQGIYVDKWPDDFCANCQHGKDFLEWDEPKVACYTDKDVEIANHNGDKSILIDITVHSEPNHDNSFIAVAHEDLEDIIHLNFNKNNAHKEQLGYQVSNNLEVIIYERRYIDAMAIK